MISGKIAEKMLLGENSSKAQSDLVKSYNISQKMVTKLGMGKIGLLSLKDDDYKIYGEHTNKLIDSEIKLIIKEASQKMKALLEEKKDLLIKFKDILLEKESLDHK